MGFFWGKVQKHFWDFILYDTSNFDFDFYLFFLSFFGEVVVFIGDFVCLYVGLSVCLSSKVLKIEKSSFCDFIVCACSMDPSSISAMAELVYFLSSLELMLT